MPRKVIKNRTRKKNQRKKRNPATRSARKSPPDLKLVPTFRSKASEFAADITSGIRHAFETDAGSISNETLFNFLSEFLAVEKGGIKLYTAARDRSAHSEIRDIYKEYLQQTKKHAELLTNAIHKLGGDPDFMSPGAMVQEQRARSMLTLVVPAELREIADAENLLLAETKDHADWEFLEKIYSKLEDPEAQDVIHEIVGEVEHQEDEHVKFARKAVDKLIMEMALNPVKSKRRPLRNRRKAA